MQVHWRPVAEPAEQLLGAVKPEEKPGDEAEQAVGEVLKRVAPNHVRSFLAKCERSAHDVTRCAMVVRCNASAERNVRVARPLIVRSSTARFRPLSRGRQ